MSVQLGFADDIGVTTQSSNQPNRKSTSQRTLPITEFGRNRRSPPRFLSSFLFRVGCWLLELFFPIGDRASGTSPRALEPPNGLASHIRERALDQVDAHDAKMPSGGNGGKPPRATEGVGPSSQGSTPQSSVPPSAGHSRQASWSIAEDPGTYRRSTSSVDCTDLAGAGAVPPPPARPPSRSPGVRGGAVPVGSSNHRANLAQRTESEQLSAMVHVPKGSLEVGNVIVAHDKLVSSGALGLIPGGAASAKPRPLGPRRGSRWTKRALAPRCPSRSTGWRACSGSPCATCACWSPTSATRTARRSCVASGASSCTSSRSVCSSPPRRCTCKTAETAA